MFFTPSSTHRARIQPEYQLNSKPFSETPHHFENGTLEGVFLLLSVCCWMVQQVWGKSNALASSSPCPSSALPRIRINAMLHVYSARYAFALSGTLGLWAAQTNTPQRSLGPSSSVFYFLFYFLLFFYFLRSALILEVIKPLTTYLKIHNISVNMQEAQLTKWLKVCVDHADQNYADLYLKIH